MNPLSWIQNHPFFALGSLKSTRLIQSGHPVCIPLDFQAACSEQKKRVLLSLGPWSLLLGVGFLGFLLPDDQGSSINLMALESFDAHHGILALLPELHGFDAVDRVHFEVREDCLVKLFIQKAQDFF